MTVPLRKPAQINFAPQAFFGRGEYCPPAFGFQCNNTYTYHPTSTPCLMPVSLKKTSAAAPAVDSPERRRLPPLLRRAWYGLNRAFRRRLAHLGLTPDQFTVMRTLLEHEGISQRQLTSLMSSDPNTVASLLERMEKAG